MMRLPKSRSLLSLLLLVAFAPGAHTPPAAAATAADTRAGAAASPMSWPQFRGPGALPVSANPSLPLSWSQTENVEWVANVPGVGWSSPVVWVDGPSPGGRGGAGDAPSRGKVFLTTAVSDREMKAPSLGTDFSNEYVAELMKKGASEEEVEKKIYERDMEMPHEVTLSYRLLCLDLESGAVVWDREFHAGRPPVGRHRKNSFTSETPVTDGKAIYVYVAHLGLWAYDLDGEKLWHTPLEPRKVYLDFGGGTSPALWRDRLFIVNDNEEASFVAAFDAKTGKQLWRVERAGMGVGGRKSGWASPFVWENELRAEVVTIGPGFAISYDVDGKELWRLPMQSAITIASPFAWNGTLYLASGAGGEPVRPVAAIRPGASGEIALPTPPPAPTAEAETVEAETGERSAKEGAEEEQSAQGQPEIAGDAKLVRGEPGDPVAWYDPAAGGPYLPTPLVYDGRLYVLNERGVLAVRDAETGEEIYKSRIHREARNFTASPWAYRDSIFMINEEGATFVIAAGGDQVVLRGINRLDDFVEATPALSGDRLLIRTKSKLYSIRDTR